MSDTHTSSAPDPHAAAAHAGGHDEHGHVADTLGPVDVQMWGVGVVGVIAALVIVACFVLATSFVFGA